MKLYVKILSAFVVVLLLLATLMATIVVTGNQVDEAMAKMGRLTAERDQLNNLTMALHEEYSLGLKYYNIPHTEDVILAEVLAEKEVLCVENDDLYETLLASFEKKGLTCDTHLEMAEDFALLLVIIDEMDAIFEANATAYASGQLDRAEVYEFIDIYSDEMENILGHAHVTEATRAEDEHIGMSHILILQQTEIDAAFKMQDDAVASMWTFSMVIATTAIMVAVILGLILSQQITTRLSGISKAAVEIRNGNLNVSVPEKGNDEVTELSKSFNQMILSVRLLTGDLGAPDNKNLSGYEGSETAESAD